MHEGHRDRLRERYIKNGIGGLEEHEILELLLTYAIPRRNTNDIAHALIRRFGSLGRVMRAEIPELTSVEGVGRHTAVFLRLHGQLLRKVQEEGDGVKREQLRLHTPAAAAAFALRLLREERYECVYTISLDKNLRLLYAERLLAGTLTEAPLYPRRVVESALQHRAHALLLVHNHPSGDATPSGNDMEATEAVKRALESIDIRLHDHLITGDGVVYSCLRGILIEPAEQEGAQPRRVSLPAGSARGPQRESSDLLAAESKDI